MVEAIKFGVTATGTIANEGEKASYIFNATKGNQIYVGTGAEFGPAIKLFGPDGSLIKESSDFWSNQVALQGRANLTGVYKVILSDSGGTGTGDYGLTVQRTNNPGNPTVTKFGVPITSSIDSYGEEDSYSFTAQIGDQIYVGTGAEFGPEIKLFGPDGSLIKESSDFWSNQVALQGRANLNGTYTVLVSDAGGTGNGDYGLTVQRTNKSANIIPVKFDITVNGSVDNYGEEDSYVFVGQANTKISLDVGGEFSPEIKLFGPDGSLIKESSDFWSNNISSLATLTENGKYTVLVSDAGGGGVGNYGLTVSNLGKPPARNIKGTSSSNTLKGDYGYDTINGLAGNDTLYGYDGNDQLIGGDGKDVLYGGTGEDILDGGKGSDTLIGEQGKDKFLFNTGRKFQTGDVGIDTLKDFDPYADKIILDKTTFTSLNSVAGNGFSVTGEFAVVKENTAVSGNKAEIVYNSTTGELFYNPNGVATNYGEGGLFATLTGMPALTKASFILQA